MKADAQKIKNYILVTEDKFQEFGNIVYYNDKTDEYKQGKDSMDQFDLDEVYNHLFDTKKKERGVGSIARSAGWASLHLRRKNLDNFVTPQTTKYQPSRAPMHPFKYPLEDSSTKLAAVDYIYS